MPANDFLKLKNNVGAGINSYLMTSWPVLLEEASADNSIDDDPEPNSTFDPVADKTMQCRGSIKCSTKQKIANFFK